ncbi:TetR/AcrR family transcriptional regulator [Streptomyces sp. NPDC056254]|uniref:TetR/AcrR family transcriptional regulator n=1 Tax=Streptomyces sp. NPDC056254 TaxID=3345763 RepID=UPI0035DB1871
MPKLWNETIEAHRREVREAILDATAALVAEHGLRAVTMSQIAEGTGIGRATLYKYFSDVEAILGAWHERQVGHHLHQLSQVRDEAADPGARLEAVLTAYALMTSSRAGHDADVAAYLHHGPHVAHAHEHLHRLISDLIAEAAVSGDLRADTDPGELATYCLHALSAARSLPSEAAVRRLVQFTLAGLRNPG